MKSVIVVLVLSLLSLGCLVLGQHTTQVPAQEITVFQHNGEWITKEGRDLVHGVAVASFVPAQNVTGWGEISIITNPAFSDIDQMYAAGYAEGSLTYDLIYYAWTSFDVADNSTDLENWVLLNLAWMEKMITNNPNDDYWIHVNYTLSQYKGMADAIQTFAPSDQVLFPYQLMLWNAAAEVSDITSAINASSSVPVEEAVFKEHCSSFVKLTDDFSDLYAGHTTWTSYGCMLRMFKSYEFQLSNSGTASKKVIFSGYPGCIMSQDDFYVTSAELTVMETTIGWFNNSLYQYIVPETVYCWIRAVVSNRISSTGNEWAQNFARYNSGTYSNQWIVVDFKQFTPYNDLGPGTLTILEQIPGYIEYADMTQTLAFGYWPSYNIPYFESIYQLAGWNDEPEGPIYTYNLSPRAKIFRRDQSKVQNLTDFMWEMQYNDWENDPFSLGDPGNQISSRFDLEPNTTNIDAFGGIDSKVTSDKLVSIQAAWAISGPTHETQPVFSWSTYDGPETIHLGQPDTFDFDWQFFIFNSSNSQS